MARKKNSAYGGDCAAWRLASSRIVRLFTFALGGTAKLDIPPFGHSGPPKPAIHMNATRETVREGKFLFSEQCMPCHGIDAVASSLPDLRYASAEVHHQFTSIVLGGARESRGMPSFKNVLDENKVHAIQAYVLSRAAESSHPEHLQ